jgi:hypothetical protein
MENKSRNGWPSREEGRDSHGGAKGFDHLRPCEQWTESLEDMRISEGRMDDIGAAWRDLRDDSDAQGGGDDDDSDHDSSRRKSGSRPSQPSVIQSSMSGLWQAILSIIVILTSAGLRGRSAAILHAESVGEIRSWTRVPRRGPPPLAPLLLHNTHTKDFKYLPALKPRCCGHLAVA